LAGFDNGAAEALTRLRDLVSSLRDAAKRLVCAIPALVQQQLRRDVGIEQSKLLRHGDLSGGSVLGARLARGGANCPTIRRSLPGQDEQSGRL
jgi:hypothetical protein